MIELIEHLSKITNDLDNIQMGLQQIRENYTYLGLEYAIQKLSEAVFWLEMVETDLRGEDNIEEENNE